MSLYSEVCEESNNEVNQERFSCHAYKAQSYMYTYVWQTGSKQSFSHVYDMIEKTGDEKGSDSGFWCDGNSHRKSAISPSRHPSGPQGQQECPLIRDGLGGCGHTYNVIRLNHQLLFQHIEGCAMDYTAWDELPGRHLDIINQQIFLYAMTCYYCIDLEGESPITDSQEFKPNGMEWNFGKRWEPIRFLCTSRRQW